MALRCDLIIRDATLFDGTGAPRRVGDVGVTGDRITGVGDLGAATADREVIATGKALAPGFIDGGMSAPIYADPKIRAIRGGGVPFKKELGTPEQIADAVLFLASEQAHYIHGHQLVVDGGVVPSVLAQLPRA